jgi:ferritin-like metal-binding protein YciE
MDQPNSERILQWLRDAHSMEAEAETMLKAMASRLEHYPELKQRIEQHVTETQSQARRIEAHLQAMGSSTSTTKNAIAHAMATMHAAGNSMLSDEVVKGLGISYAFEHMEIAAYRCLLLAAEAVGDTGTAQLCREILPEEEAMAEWLLQHQPSVVQQFLARDQAEGETAKR